MISSLEVLGLESSKTLHMSAYSLGTFHMDDLFNFSKFPFPFSLFLNKILLDIKIFSKHLRSFNSVGIGSVSILVQTAWHDITFFEICLCHVPQTYILPLKNVTVWCSSEVKIYFCHGKVWHNIDKENNDKLSNYNRALTLSIDEIFQLR